MRKTGFLFCTAGITAVLLLVASAFAAQDPPPARANPPADTVPVAMVVTALGPNFSPAPALSRDDIAVYSNNTRENVASFEPARNAKAGMQLAFLIDDDASPSALGPHLNELRSFIQAQPSTTEVGI